MVYYYFFNYATPLTIWEHKQKKNLPSPHTQIKTQALPTACSAG
jgi:hypothetical protein